MNQLNNLRTTTTILSLNFSTLYSKFQHNKILLVLNSLVDFCIDAEKVNKLQVVVMELVE